MTADRVVYCSDYDPCRCICLFCPVHGDVFCIDKDELARPGIRCPVCGAELVLAPKDPSLMAQMVLYREMMLLLRKIERKVLGDLGE